jgi:hypothetical protein
LAQSYFQSLAANQGKIAKPPNAERQNEQHSDRPSGCFVAKYSVHQQVV